MRSPTPDGRSERGELHHVPPLWERFDQERSGRAQLSVWEGSGFVEWTWDEWRRRAFRIATGLRNAGVEKGSRVACLLTNSPGACAMVLGAWAAGATIISVPTMARGMRAEAYLDQLRRICKQAEPQLVASDPAIARQLRDAELAHPVFDFESLEHDGHGDPELATPRGVIFVQYSSGATGEPRGCQLEADAIAFQLSALERVVGVDADTDSLASWLPLSHDMGLFGCLLFSYWTGIPLTLGTPARFLRRPASWLEDCARARATMTAAPNFAWDLVARAARGPMPGRFPMRVGVIGGERVEAGTLNRVREVFGDDRFPLSCFSPAYGLAEAVLAVTMSPVGQTPRVLEVDARALAAGQVLETKPGAPGNARLVSVGPPLPGHEIRVRGPGPVGEVCVRSSGLASGYLDKPELTRRAFTDGELRTGDLGFCHEGELYITGRADDMFIVGGRNIFACSLEAELGQLAALRPGCVAVVDIIRDDQTRVALIAEVGADAPAPQRLARQLTRRSREVAGVRLNECHFVPAGLLPKTPSGKLQRFQCRQLALTPPDGTHSVCA